MSRFESFIRSLTSPVRKADGRPPERTAGDTRRRHEWKRRRERYHSGQGTVEKQSVDRRAQAFAAIEDSVIDRGGMRKPYDPLFLRDIAANAVVQAYIDTLAQDVASAGWKLKPRDEDANVDDNQLAEWERELRDLHPELPFRDVLEETARILLELGDATWVKHYYSGSNDLAEFVVVDSSTMFKRVDDYGITEGYLQASRRNRDVANQFDEDEVVWFSWSLRPDRHYGQGPLEKAQNEVELIEELAEKERLDLVAGSPPGVMSPDFTDDFGTVPDEDWDTFVDAMRLEEGERHRVGYSKIPMEFTPINHTYQELQILDRSKYWVTVLGSVFKVNPSYAGFDFENTNRATDETQQEAYAQRGFRVTLRQLEESINRGLVWDEFSEDVRFEFEREQTVGEKESRANLIQTQAEAGQKMAAALEDDDAGVHFRDGEIVVDDGEIGPEDQSGPGGGFFASVDGPDEADGAITTKSAGDDSTDYDGDLPVVAMLSTDEWARYEKHLIDAHVSQIAPESVDDIEKRAWRRADDVPKYVRDGIAEAIDRGAVFNRFENIPGTLVDTLERVLRDNLTDRDGWSLDAVVDDLSATFPGVDEDNLEVIARTETTSVLNDAREVGYQSRDDSDKHLFYWQGPGDSRTTELCRDMKIATGVESGTPETDFDEVPGEPVPMKTLVRLQRQASKHHFPNLQFRRHTPHINCRHTFVRDATADLDFEIEVDIPGRDAFNKAVSKSCGCGEVVDYESVVGSVIKYGDSRTRRELEIERALGESIEQILRRAFTESGGTIAGAKRAINDRLRQSANYDEDENGLLSKDTLYTYRDKYEDAVADVV